MLVKVEGVKCPKCGSDEHYAKSLAEQNVFSCQNEISPKVWCNETTCKCEKCNKVYALSGFGYRNNAYECKVCGTIHWGLTEKKQRDDAFKAFVKGFDNKLDSLYKKYGWK